MFSEGSIRAVMGGHRYNSAVRLHEFVYGAMMRLAWQAFLLRIHVNLGVEVHHLEAGIMCVSTFHDEVGDATCCRMVLLFRASWRHRE